ncbi:MAG: hypothetical protein CVT80_00650 [Alphaproteobacteria bacterium HGW-Alphaproteobacteria-2]|nr:MAG: hypothetical protein CVT80_00650 [Alphaproteobacteria bacterium HGW-Alphaproteobacteria-2]
MQAIAPYLKTRQLLGPRCWMRVFTLSGEFALLFRSDGLLLLVQLTPKITGVLVVADIAVALLIVATLQFPMLVLKVNVDTCIGFGRF